MMLYICTCFKFRENNFYAFKVIERTRFLYKNYKGTYFRKNVREVTVFFLCTSSDAAVHLFDVTVDDVKKIAKDLV